MEKYSVDAFESPQTLKNNKYVLPDLFLLDLHMPYMDGLSYCRLLKGEPLTSLIPVIIMSALPAFENAAFDSGAAAAIEKPFEIRVLRELIKKVLNGFEHFSDECLV